MTGPGEDVAVREIWLEDTGGDADLLLMLHPGGTDSRAMQPLTDALDQYRIVAFDRPGHGRSPDIDEDWSFAGMAAVAAGVLASTGAGPAHLVGWSDGAIVGLYLALRRPDLVRSLVFGGAPFDVSGWDAGVLDAGDPPDFMADRYAEVSPDAPDHWPEVVRKAALLHRTEPDVTVAQLQTLRLPVLILTGDDDEVRLDHLTAMLQAVPDGELAVVPRATHGLIVEKPDLVALLIRQFHEPTKNNGLAPRRRNTTD